MNAKTTEAYESGCITMKTTTEKLAQIADQKLAESLRKPNSYDAWID